MKKLICLITFLMFCGCAIADTKITALPSNNSPTSDDIVVTVDNPNGTTPVTSKTTLSGLQTFILTGNGSNLTGLTKSQIGLNNAENTALSTWGGSANITTVGTIATGTIPDSHVTFTDVTTGNVTTGNHGYITKLDNVSTHYYNGQGGWTTPSTTSAGGWTDSGTVVYNTTAARPVIVGSPQTQHGSDLLSVYGTIYSSGGFIGNASTATSAVSATSLGANGSNCSAGQYPLGVDASGNSEGCAAITQLGIINTGAWQGTPISYVYGGLGLTTAANNTVPIGNGSGYTAQTLPDCVGTGKALSFTAATNTWTCNSITATSVAWPAITGAVSGANWTDATAGFIRVASVNWSDMKNLSSQTINWSNIDMYAKSFNGVGSAQTHIQAFNTTGLNWSSLDFPTSTNGNINWTMPVVSGNILVDANTISQRVNPRITTTASTTSWTINSDATDIAIQTALAGAITINAPTGTPVDGQGLTIRLTGTAARGITWNGAFTASTDLALPSTTTTTKTLYCRFIYNSTTASWQLVAKLDNF